jgi:hypothetical protein
MMKQATKDVFFLKNSIDEKLKTLTATKYSNILNQRI